LPRRPQASARYRPNHIERFLREAWIPRLAPVSPQLILCFIAEKVLGLPKSY
jgi:acyl-CoA dehydrogenase